MRDGSEKGFEIKFEGIDIVGAPSPFCRFDVLVHPPARKVRTFPFRGCAVVVDHLLLRQRNKNLVAEHPLRHPVLDPDRRDHALVAALRYGDVISVLDRRYLPGAYDAYRLPNAKQAMGYIVLNRELIAYSLSAFFKGIDIVGHRDDVFQSDLFLFHFL